MADIKVLKKYDKDPDATLNYAWDWTSWLVDGDTIASVEFLFPGDANTMSLADQSDNGLIAVALLSGGTEGQTHYVTCRVTTLAGLIDDRTCSFVIKER